MICHLGLILVFHLASAVMNLSVGPEYYIGDIDLMNCNEKSDPTKSGKTQHVYIALSILDIDRIDENNMDFNLHGYFTAKWFNQNLRLNYMNKSRPFTIPEKLANCMWKPDLIFPNTKTVKDFAKLVPNIEYKVLPNGMFYRTERLIFRISCPMTFYLYPMDSQHCSLRIGLMGNPDDVVTLHWDGEEDGVTPNTKAIDIIYPINPLQFHVADPSVDKLTREWDTGTFTELTLNITFHRRLIGSFVNSYLPSTLVVALSWLSFWIDPAAVPGRVTLGVTSLLTITTLMIQSRSGIPPVQYITAMDIWLFACLTSVFASLIEYGFAHSVKDKVKPKVEEKLMSVPCPQMVRSKSKSIRSNYAWHERQMARNVPLKNKFDTYSKWLFPFLMFTFSIIYWVCYLRSI